MIIDRGTRNELEQLLKYIEEKKNENYVMSYVEVVSYTECLIKKMLKGDDE